KDGMLDFYIGFPGNRDFTFLNDHQSRGDKVSQGFFLNQGSLSFEDATKASRLPVLDDLKDHKSYVFPHSALAFDFNGDHLPDILVVDDRGNLSPMYKNNGDGTFTQVNEQTGIRSFGMGAAVASTHSDGRLDVVMTSITLTD